MVMIASTSKWLSHANEVAKTGKFTSKEALIEWEKATILSSELAEFKKKVCELACQVLAPLEVEFLKQYPQAATEEIFLNACAPLLKEHNIDWKLVEETIKSTIKQFYLMDLSSFGELLKPLLEDVYFLLTIKESEGASPLGFAMLGITPVLPFGTIKLINMVVLPEAKVKGFDQLLMNSIYKILPEIDRVFLFIRPTNKKDFQTYSKWGFVQNPNPIQDPNHKINSEYMINLETKLRN